MFDKILDILTINNQIKSNNNNNLDNKLDNELNKLDNRIINDNDDDDDDETNITEKQHTNKYGLNNSNTTTINITIKHIYGKPKKNNYQQCYDSNIKKKKHTHTKQSKKQYSTFNRHFNHNSHNNYNNTSFLYEGKYGFILNNYLNKTGATTIYKYLNSNIKTYCDNNNNVQIYLCNNRNIFILIPKYMMDKNINNCIKNIIQKSICYACCSLDVKSINNIFNNNNANIIFNYFVNDDNYLNELYNKIYIIQNFINKIINNNDKRVIKKNNLITFSTLY